MSTRHSIVDKQFNKFLIAAGIVGVLMVIGWPIIYFSIDGSDAHKQLEAMLVGREFPETGIVQEVSVSPFGIMGFSKGSGMSTRAERTHFVAVAKGPKGKKRIKVRLERYFGEKQWDLVRSDPPIPEK
ncbi:hypothetical protein KQI84_01415 [bacterium]|nr:hypothetical protein [bacterium]